MLVTQRGLSVPFLLLFPGQLHFLWLGEAADVVPFAQVWSGVLPWYLPGQAVGLHQGGLARNLSCLLPGTWIIVSGVSGLGPLDLALDPWRHPQERMFTLFLPHVVLADPGSVTHSPIRSGSPLFRWYHVFSFLL